VADDPVFRLSGVSKDLLKAFHLDVQTDCACSTESYDLSGLAAYWDEGGIVRVAGRRLDLPMQPGQPTDDLLRTLLAVPHKTAVLAVNLAGWGAFVT
jgi:hypothetical protein